MNKVYSVISGAISFWIPATVMVYVYIRWIRHSRKVSQDWVRFWPKSCSVLKIFNIIYGGRLLVVLVSFVSSSTNFVQNFLKFEWCVSASFAKSYAFTKIFQVLRSKISLGTESDSALFQSAQSPTRVELASAESNPRRVSQRRSFPIFFIDSALCYTARSSLFCINLTKTKLFANPF